MPDQVLDLAWSDISPGHFVRWATPRFIKYGRVLKREKNSMLAQFIEDPSPRAIPEAKWYFVQGKRDPAAEEHLVVIDYSTWYNDGVEITPFVPEQPSRQNISTAAACELLAMDPKQLRRFIRRGTIQATKVEDRWVINREALLSTAAKNGWI